MELVCTPVETESTGTGLDINTALRPEEEPDLLLSGPAESEEEQTLSNGDEIGGDNEKGDEVEKEHIEEIKKTDFPICPSDT